MPSALKREQRSVEGKDFPLKYPKGMVEDILITVRLW